MQSDGEPGALENWVRIVRTYMDALQCDLDIALASLSELPDSMREPLRERFDRSREQHRFRRRRGALIERSGPKPWFQEWDPAQGYLWPRLRTFLLDRKGWDLEEVDDLDMASDKILSHLEDPRAGRATSLPSFRSQGLVLGYVQAGKTANYTALIAKAADCGYRLIVVLAGIHNSLRQQTQRRLDLELGLVDDPKGVGLPTESEQVWWSITNSSLQGDFNPGTDAGPLQVGARGIMVVKKNATVLRRIRQWLEGRVPPDLPVLIIDDEADQASINLNPDQIDLVPADMESASYEEELDPSTINGLIRGISESFGRVAYVAYTATPFANVLIHPDATNSRVGADLFPRDFIISLDRPAKYVGAERIFGRAALETEEDAVDGLDIVRIVEDVEVPHLAPRSRDASSWVPTITPSLRDAIYDWILATAARNHRLGDGVSSMLIHTTHRIQQQLDLGDLVRSEVVAIRNEWRYDRQALRPLLEAKWEGDFRRITSSVDVSLDASFKDVERELSAILGKSDGIRVKVLNSQSQDVLDYESDPFMKVILIGGNRLSRGLTLENLMTSFYVRGARAYDTLLQMARWFGFRQDYVDLTRLWATQELVSNFRHLSLVEEDLRDQIKIYERSGLTPEQVAPRIRSHPSMLVTARNRMGSAEVVRQSYAGQLLQTFRFNLEDPEWLRANEECTIDLIRSLAPALDRDSSPEGRPTWNAVPWDYVEGFLRRFRTAQDRVSFDADTAASYIRRQATGFGELLTWTVTVRGLLRGDHDLGDWRIGVPEVEPVHRISRSRRERDSIGALINPVSRTSLGAADEALDLSPEQVSRALQDYDAEEMPTLGDALRHQRDPGRGLLVIYPISPFSQPGPNVKDESRMALFPEGAEGMPTVVGVALSFPPSNTGATVEYVAGAPGQHAISPDEEAEDY